LTDEEKTLLTQKIENLRNNNYQQIMSKYEEDNKNIETLIDNVYVQKNKLDKLQRDLLSLGTIITFEQTANETAENNSQNNNSTINVLNKYLGNSINHSNELKKVLDNLSKQEDKINEFNNKEWWDVSKIFFKDAKWEEQASYIYEGIRSNFLLNRDNSKVILQMMKIIVGHEYKISKNLEKVNKVIKTNIKGGKSKLRALKNIKNDIQIEKEKTKEELAKIQNDMNESMFFSNDIIDILSQMTGNYGEKISTIDEKIIEIEEQNIRTLKKINGIKKGKFFNILTIINSMLLIFLLIILFLIK